jgi:hypothetical protein
MNPEKFSATAVFAEPGEVYRKTVPQGGRHSDNHARKSDKRP